MRDPQLLAKIQKAVDAGLVRASSRGNLTVFKYTQDCVVQGEWNDITRLCRGLVMDTEGTVVARPFTKFFNLHEREETKPEALPWDEPYIIFDKLDGSCGIGYNIDGTWRLATPGSLESDQAIRGTEILNTQYADNLHFIPGDSTPVFEIIYPENRIVVDYGETFLCLLAIFDKNGTEWHPNRVDQVASNCGFRRPHTYDFDLREAISGDLPFDEGLEGYVVRFESGLRVKLKSPWYVRIHRLLDYLSPKRVIELIRGREYRATVEELPKEIQAEFDDIRAYVQGLFDSLVNEAEDIRGRVPVAERKEQAQFIIGSAPNYMTGLVFGLLDSKDITEGAWRIVLQKVKDEAGRAVATE